ncbi:ABC transporter substrate-binding protein [Nakamurella aerolata]|uniref:ABC transporter substrate-binding protein n=1 Tax=Nakamurella aerolata TaxID=1656892 RepID=A0A849A8D8_9ACTN|nr:ABC transporter substrate-binding protein [Nakamurella aerolata]NNG37234.1 ABC transporter substrate-binding protein [Nakamurella aerolata]
MTTRFTTRRSARQLPDSPDVNGVPRAAAPVRARRAGLTAAVLVPALLLAACGSSGDDGAAASSTTTSSSSAGATGTADSGAAGATGSGAGAAAGSSGADASAGSGAGSSASSSGTGPSSAVASATGSGAPGSGAVGGSAANSGAAGTSGAATPAGLDAKGCITDFDPATDYYPVKQKVIDAKQFSISYHKSYQVVTVKQEGGPDLNYVLQRCGAPAPELSGALAKAPVVTTPVTSLYSGSTTHLPALVELGKLDVLKGVSSTAFVSEPEVLDYIKKQPKSDPVVSYAPSGTVDAEVVIKNKPQVVIGGGFPDAADAKITAAGIPVLQDVDSSEPNPLGQAEWVKFFGALTGTEAKATETYDKIANSYRKTAKLVSGEDPVQVLPNTPYQGAWYIPGGKTLKGRLIADAGGTTAWADDPSPTAIKTTIEAVYAKAAKAPIWIADATWTSLGDATKVDKRLANFTAFKDKQVWNAVKGTTPEGGNPMYELGAARPDLVLEDLVAILHPKALPDHEFTFYEKLK